MRKPRRLIRGRFALGLVAALIAAACTPLRPSRSPQIPNTSVRLHNHALTLHLSAPRRDRAPILIVYATGDAGWWGKDRDMYSHVAALGYATVGFSAREYVHHLGKDAMLPREVARDYAAIIDTAEGALGLSSSTRAVLVGKSRGAGLAVAAAGPDLLKPHLAGIVAVGLTREEEYVHHRLRRSRRRELVMLQTYSYLPQLGDVPIAVIQSTHDDYVPADEARALFGSDSASRSFIAVEARDHNFSGALDRMYDALEQSVEWIVRR